MKFDSSVVRGIRNRGNRLGLVTLTMLICGAQGFQQSVALDSMPIPRVETGGHTGAILKLSVDRSGTMLLTVSEDKTARLWHAESGRLLQILRVPIENGHEGQLYAAALTPNGRIAAIAGFTGSFSGKSIVYFFDTASGHLRSTQSTYSDAAVENLAFSDDGRLLAVCLADGRGVRLFSLEKQSLLKSEQDMRDKVLGAAFAPNGDFAVTTYDGTLWMFRAAAQYASTTVKLTAGRKPEHVQFSPDGNEMVVGYDGDPTFSIFDTHTLKEVFKSSLPPEAAQKGLHVVEWSADGKSLYAGGEGVAGTDALVYRFAQQGRGNPERVLISTKRITDLRRLPQGGIAFASAEPEVGVIEATGHVRWRYRSSIMDLKRMTSEFHLSPTGNALTFGTAERANLFTFDVLKPAELALQRVSTAPIATEIRNPSGWKIQVSDDQEHLTINGSTVALDNRESVRNWFFTKTDTLVVGTSWSLRQYDSSAKLIWSVPMQANVALARPSDDGHVIVVALSDGSMHWLKPEDGKEFLSLFVNRNGHDWIAWIPNGYYMSSTTGDNFIGWHINHGVDHDPDFYRAVQFERTLYRPDLVQTYFRERGPGAAFIRQESRDRQSVASLATILPPHLEISVRTTEGDPLAHVRVTGESHGLPMQDWSLFLNGIPTVAGQSLAGAESTAFSKEIGIQLPRGLNRLQAESMATASAGRSLGIADEYAAGSGNDSSASGVLYILAIGVGQFTDPAIGHLRFANNDATDLVKTFGQIYTQAGFASIQTKLLVDADATKQSIAATLRPFLSSVRGEDSVIVFLASHGISDKLGNYFFVPTDAKFADVKALDTTPERAASLVRWDVVVDAMRRTAGHRLLIVDTCSSGASGGNFDLHSLAKRSMSSNFALMAAAGTKEESQELESAHHGLFTYGLLEAIKTGYDPNHDGVVSLSEAFEFAFDTVQDKRNKAVGQQTPQLSAPDVLLSMALARGASSAPAAAAIAEDDARLADLHPKGMADRNNLSSLAKSRVH